MVIIFLVITRSVRAAVIFGAGFVGIIYAVIVVTYLASGQVETEATPLTIESIETDGYPDARHLKVTGGYVAFSLAHVKLDKGDDGEAILFRVTAPVVSESIWLEWKERIDQDGPIDASRVRLLASFDNDQMSRRWPELKAKAESGQPLAGPPAQMELAGDTEPAKYMVFKARDFEDRTENFDEDRARSLTFERRAIGPGMIVKNSAVAFGLFVLAFCVFRVKPPARRRIMTKDGEFIRKSPRIPSGEENATLAIQPGQPGAMAIEITDVAPELLNKGAVLRVEAEAYAGGFYSWMSFEPASKAREAMFSQEVVLSNNSDTFTVSLRDLRIYPFKGETVEIRLYATLATGDMLVTETPIDLESLRPVTIVPALEADIAVPYPAGVDRVGVLGRQFATIDRKPISAEARAQRMVALGDLFAGEATEDLEDVRLRVLVRNTERLYEVYSGRVTTTVVERRKAFREALIYETTLPPIAKGQAIEGVVDHSLSFSEIFSAHYPVATIAARYGVGFDLEVHLVHPEHGCIVSTPVFRNRWGQSTEVFEFEDFL
jgi:hypothetical protein